MGGLRTGAARAQAPLAAPFHEWRLQDGATWASFHRDGEGYWLRFPGLADFRVGGDGGSIQGWPAPGVSRATLRHIYWNQVLPLAQSRQGRLMLHGGAVEIGTAAVAFLGPSGRGKSTLTAGFATSGFRFLADDALQIEPGGGGCRVLPSHPSVRLWQDSEAALLGADAPKAPPVQYTPKARMLAGRRLAFCAEARPLRRVYVLGEGLAATPAFARLGPAETVAELVRHSFLLDIEARDLLSAHFDTLVGLAAQGIFFRLDYPRRFGKLARVVQAIVEHASQ